MWKLHKMHCCEALKELHLLSYFLQNTNSEKPDSGKLNQQETVLREKVGYLFLDFCIQCGNLWNTN